MKVYLLIEGDGEFPTSSTSSIVGVAVELEIAKAWITKGTAIWRYRAYEVTDLIEWSDL